MKISELLFEYDLKKIQQLDSLLAQRQKDTSRPPASSAKELADWLEKEKNIQSGELVYWILSRYLKPLTDNQYGINRWEDIGSRLIPGLDKYTKLKNKKKIPSEKRDINQIKSLGELEELLDQFPDEEVASKKEQRSEEEQGYYNRKEATLLYNDPQIKVVVPHTEEASCYFGKNTKWCTAARSDNMFDDYNDQGPLYIVLIKPLNQRYQFHWGKTGKTGNQFMDERDIKINPMDLADQYPMLWNIFTPIAKKKRSVVLNKNPSEAMQIAAVQRDGSAIQYIKNPSEAIQLAAVKTYGSASAIRYIKNPSEAIQIAAVQQNGSAIQYIKNPSEAVQLAAVKQKGWAIRSIPNPSEAVQLAAVQQDGSAIDYIKNPSEAVQIAAVKPDGTAIVYIKNPSEAVQLAAVKRNSYAIIYIKNPSEQVQLAAVNQDPYAIQNIKNPTPRVQALAKQLGER